MNLNGETYSCVFVITRKLNKNCVQGIDFLKNFKGRIDMEKNYIISRNEDKKLNIEFIDDEEKCIRLDHKIYMEPNEELIN